MSKVDKVGGWPLLKISSVKPSTSSVSLGTTWCCPVTVAGCLQEPVGPTELRVSALFQARPWNSEFWGCQTLPNAFSTRELTPSWILCSQFLCSEVRNWVWRQLVDQTSNDAWKFKVMICLNNCLEKHSVALPLSPSIYTIRALHSHKSIILIDFLVCLPITRYLTSKDTLRGQDFQKENWMKHSFTLKT